MLTVGIDIVEIDRIESLMAGFGTRFLDRVYTKKEQDYCEASATPAQRYAGRFAAKEALKKALQPFVTLRFYPFNAIEVLPGDYGVPGIELLQPLNLDHNYNTIAVSISHETHYAVASVIIQ